MRGRVRGWPRLARGRVRDRVRDRGRDRALLGAAQHGGARWRSLALTLTRTLALTLGLVGAA